MYFETDGLSRLRCAYSKAARLNLKHHNAIYFLAKCVNRRGHSARRLYDEIRECHMAKAAAVKMLVR